MLHKEITDIILRSFFDVFNQLGYGFLEKVYENALLIELEERGLKANAQKKVEVHYHDQNIGTYFADIAVEEKVIIELKACEQLHGRHKNQLINYLKATDFEVGLLLNFGQDPTFKRVIFSNQKGKFPEHYGQSSSSS